MKRINTGFAADPSPQQPFTTKSLDFLQDSTKEMVYVICRNIISSNGYTYSTTVPYLISSVAGMPFTSDGAVFFNGELYILKENTASLTYAVLDITPDPNADPLLFSDSVNRDVHNDRYLSYTNTLSGSLFAVADIVDARIPNNPKAVVSQYNAPVINASFTSSTLLYPNEITDTDAQFNPATGKFKAKKIGVFNFTADVVLTSSTDFTADPAGGLPVRLSLYKNGSATAIFSEVVYKGLDAYVTPAVSGSIKVTSVTDEYTFLLSASDATFPTTSVYYGGSCSFTFVE